MQPETTTLPLPPLPQDYIAPGRDPIVYHSISNPKGEKSQYTTFYNENQLPRLAPRTAGLPMKILHFHTHADEKETPASGRVVHSGVHPVTGELHTFFVLNDSEAGKAAQLLTGEIPGLPKEKLMNSVSLGYSVEISDDMSVRNKANEVSLCWEPDRPGTHIINKIPLSKLIEMSKEDSKQDSTQTSTPPPPITQPFKRLKTVTVFTGKDKESCRAAVRDILRKGKKI
jgi:hypothetical protein